MHANNTSFRAADKYKVYAAFLYAVFCYAISFQFSGPAYASDEIGYLSKAATLSGYAVNWQTSWHAGYSIFLIPAFVVAQNPDHVWLIIVLINALMMGIAFWGTQDLLFKMFPKDSFDKVFLASLFAALYPGFIVMSGYAFATPAFIMFYVLSLLCLKNALDKGGILRWVAFAFFSGYLYWIHPLGIVPCFAAILIILKMANKHGGYAIALTSLISLGMVILYHSVFLLFLDNAMGKWGSEQSLHYSATLTELISKLATFRYWERFVSFFLGQVGGLLIGSFGFVFYIFIRDGKYKYERDVSLQYNDIVLGYMGFIIIGILTVGAFQLATGDPVTRGDFYIYGRYVEMSIMPALGAGFLCFRKNWKNVFIPLFLFVVGVFLDAVAQDALYFNEINIVAFWPRVFLMGESFFAWFLLAAFVISLLSSFDRSVIVIFSFFIFILPLIYQFGFHYYKINYHANPSGLVEYIRLNYKPGATVYFDDIKSRRGDMGDHHEMPNIYIYYLYDYKLQLMSFEGWQKIGKGPFITSYDYSSVKDSTIFVVGRNIKNSFIVYDDKTRIDKPLTSGNDNFVYAHSPLEVAKLMSTLYVGDSTTFKRFNRIGVIRKNELYTSGEGGLLLSGPRIKLAKGKYEVTLKVNALNTQNSYVDITFDKGIEVVKKIKMQDYSNEGRVDIDIPFELYSAVSDLEVKVFVDSTDSLSISEYVIKSIN